MRGLKVAVLSILLASGWAFPATGQEPNDVIESRRVQVGEADVVTVRTKVRFTTMILLPKEESILDFTCGDREYWVLDGTANFAYVKPAKAGAKTNANLITASGNVYSFLLEEVSGEPEGRPDLKLFVEPKEQSVVSRFRGEPKYVTADEVAIYREEAAIAKLQAREAKAEADQILETRIAGFLSQYPATLEFGYRFQANAKPFFVTSIWNDGRFTYIRAKPRELPALYEIRDGKPNLVEFEFRDGLLMVRKVIDGGYLAIGKTKLYFARKEEKEP